MRPLLLVVALMLLALLSPPGLRAAPSFIGAAMVKRRMPCI